MGNAANHFGKMYVKKWRGSTRSELAQKFFVYRHLHGSGGDRYKLWKNSWKGNLFVRSDMSHARFVEEILKAWQSTTDYANCYAAEEIKNLKAADPFWPVADLERALNVTFTALMKPG